MKNTLLMILTAGVVATSAMAQPVNVAVDVAADRKPINPLIYGLNFATTGQLEALNVPLNRSGGNATTRYNWEQNASNRAFDWFFQSLPEEGSGPGAGVDRFIDATEAAGAESMITIPTIGWVAKLGPSGERRWSFSIAKYGAQQNADWQWLPDAGNGVRPNGTRINDNDPNDANRPADVAFQAGWLDHLLTRYGTAASGGVRYYLMDNEPSLWHDTHRDVFKTGARMEEIRDRILQYAAMVKAKDGSARVGAPEEWGWMGYLYSGYDHQWAAAHGWSEWPDRDAHGGRDFIPWLLEELKKNHDETGTRLVDVLTVHYYPQGGEFSGNPEWDDVSPAMQLRRNHSTRSLWDPAYTDETWIAQNIRLMPRLHQWVDENYPGTQLGITEYSWGADLHVNGATVQADVLGIFGREGLDLATRWVTPPTGSFAWNAFVMYRNYDGSGSTFGETSVRATVPNPDNLAAFAAERADGALTVMLINKQLSTAATTSVNLAGFDAGSPTQVWQLGSSNTIVRQADLPVIGDVVSITLPAQTVTLLVIPRAISDSDFDPNGNGRVEVSDVFTLAGALMLGGPLSGDGDANGDAAVTAADLFYTVEYLFKGGPAPR